MSDEERRNWIKIRKQESRRPINILKIKQKEDPQLLF